MSEEQDNPIGQIQIDIALLKNWRTQDRADIDKLSEAFAHCVTDPKEGLIVKFSNLQTDIKRAWKIIAMAATFGGPIITVLILKFFFGI